MSQWPMILLVLAFLMLVAAIIGYFVTRNSSLVNGVYVLPMWIPVVVLIATILVLIALFLLWSMHRKVAVVVDNARNGLENLTARSRAAAFRVPTVAVQ